MIFKIINKLKINNNSKSNYDKTTGETALQINKKKLKR